MLRSALFATLLCGLGALACTATPAKPRAAGDLAPEFNVVDAEGRRWTLADSKAKPLLIDLWATWCGPCVQALPDLKRFHAAHNAKIQLLGIAVDTQGWAVVKPLMHRYELDYPVAVAEPKLSEAFGAGAFPYLLLVKDGKVLKRLKGRHSDESLAEALAEWL